MCECVRTYERATSRALVQSVSELTYINFYLFAELAEHNIRVNSVKYVIHTYNNIH